MYIYSPPDRHLSYLQFELGFPGSSAGKESTCKPGDLSSIPGAGKIHWRRDSLPTTVFFGFPGGSAGKESACKVFHFWVGKIPWRCEWLLTLVFWPGEFHGLYSPWICKESDTTWRLNHHHMMFLEICILILAWRAVIHGVTESDTAEWLNWTELILIFTDIWLDFPGGSVVKNPPAMQETPEMCILSLSKEYSLEEGMANHSSILAWKIL